MDIVDRLALARALHVAGIVWWIGGVAFVTAVLLPGLRDAVPAAGRMALFDRLERRFAAQARVATVVVGLSGAYLLEALSAWGRFADPAQWWLHAMVGLWALFTLMLFVLEPLVLHRWFEARAARDPDGTFRVVRRLHHVLLAASVVTVLAAVGGSHGWSWTG